MTYTDTIEIADDRTTAELTALWDVDGDCIESPTHPHSQRPVLNIEWAYAAELRGAWLGELWLHRWQIEHAVGVDTVRRWDRALSERITENPGLVGPMAAE